MPKVVAKKVAEPVAAPAPAAPAPVAEQAAEVPAKKAGVRFGKMSEEHRAKIAAEHKDASKAFKSSLRANLMVGHAWETAIEKAKAQEKLKQPK